MQRMRITISVLLLLGLCGWPIFALAQQNSVLALQTRNEPAIEIGEVIPNVAEPGRFNGAKAPYLCEIGSISPRRAGLRDSQFLRPREIW